MAMRTRKYIAVVALVGLAFALTRVSQSAGWSNVEMYAVGAALLVVFLAIVLPWLEMAPDGAWRGAPERRPPV